jgi:hypothetical protein
MKTPVLQAIAVCWGLELLLWTPVLMPQIDQLKSYKPLFEDLGEKIGSDTVIGYKLTETIEAYSLFYGGFAVDNTDEGEVFAEKLKSGAARYAIALTKRLKPEQRDLLQERGEKLLEESGKWREKIELWKLKTAAN